MNKTKSINRLFLCTVLWALACPYLLQGILSRMSAVQISVAGELLFAVPVILYLVIKRIRPNTWIPFRRIDAAVILMSLLTGFLLLPLVTFINAFSMLFATNYVSESSAQIIDNPLWVNLLIIAVIPAVTEELIYRGIFYHAYREKGVILGAVASAVVFGIMHRNLNQFFYAAVLGVIFCILVEITGSIYASMAAHFAINSWNVMLLALQKPLAQMTGETEAVQAELTKEMLVATVGVMGVIAVVSTALAAGVMIWMTKHCRREPHMRWCFRKHELPEGVKRNFVTPSFAVTAGVALVYMILLEIL